MAKLGVLTIKYDNSVNLWANWQLLKTLKSYLNETVTLTIMIRNGMTKAPATCWKLSNLKLSKRHIFRRRWVTNAISSPVRQSTCHTDSRCTKNFGFYVPNGDYPIPFNISILFLNIGTYKYINLTEIGNCFSSCNNWNVLISFHMNHQFSCKQIAWQKLNLTHNSCCKMHIQKCATSVSDFIILW